jgi:D-glycero-D-manno-heptose 1,7-bisphosphate phosphatase
MPHDAGNIALYFDLVGTLVETDETRQLPIDSSGNIVIKLLPGVSEKLLPIHDHLIFVVTNQAGIKRGRLTMDQVEAAMRDLDRQLGDIISAWNICPHDDADNCECRKPKPGMILDLAEFHGVHLPGSTMIGDQLIDEQAARNGGIGKFIYAADFFAWR